MSRHADAVAPLRASSGPVAWLGRHRRTAIEAIRRLFIQPFASLMIVLVIAVTLAIPAALNLLITNISAISAGWDNAMDFSVFLQRDISTAEASTLAALIEERADIDSVQLVTAEDALQEFRVHSGFGDALDHLNTNPLPHVIVVRPAPSNTGESIVLLQEELSNLPEVDIVQVDTEWVRRFHAILAIIKRAIAIGTALLGAAVIVIIGNTIRLEIQNRREEIEVSKLIGASNGFVRRPFLWSGFWYGLFGGLLALGLVESGLLLLEEPAAALAGLYQSGFLVVEFTPGEIAAIIGTGILLGLLGSWFAVARHLRGIEPR